MFRIILMITVLLGVSCLDGSPPPPAPDIPRAIPWCPEKGSPEPSTEGRLRIATWNLGNLHASNGQATFGGSRPSVKRFSDDYLRIRCYVRMIDPDILAVQEVDGVSALKRIVDTDVYDVHMSARPSSRSMNGKQNTGFAFKKGLDVTIKADYKKLDIRSGALRHGARMDVNLGEQTLRLMNVHLKSGCFHNGMSGASCEMLFRQIPILERWIDDAADGPQPFIVLGDFNRQFNSARDAIWTDLDDGQPENADLTAVTESMPVNCRDNRHKSFIDHIVFDKRSIMNVDRSSFRHVPFREEDRDVWDMISDHCPLVVEMVVSAD